MGMTHLAALAVAVAATMVVACSSAETYSCEPYCDNPIDRIVVPKLRAIGVSPREAEPFEHCRRIAIDLLGRGPTGAEMKACVAAPPAGRVELAQAHPDYRTATRRQWSELLGYDVLEVWSRDLFDLDGLVGEFADGRLDHAGLASAVVTHPGFLALHPEDSWAGAVYQVFLGRPARADEIAAMRPLAAPWQWRFVCEGAIWWNLFQSYREDGLSVPVATEVADLDCADVGKGNVGYNPCLCRPDDGSLGCSSSALGTTVTLTPGCANRSNPYASANVMLAGASAPGEDDTCPDGSHAEGCRDREVDEETFETLYPLTAWRRLGAAERAELDSIGAALAARGDFWEAAADRELRRLTGWWQTSFRHPDSDLPEVRAVVADLLRAGTSAREVQRIIMTSRLYAAPAAAPPEWSDRQDEPPPWAMGPTKLLAAEAWVDTVLMAVGEQPGSCDVRNLTVYGYEWELGDFRFLDDPESSLDREVEDFYIAAVTALGGCKSGVPRPTQSNVGLVFAQGEQARLACAYGDKVVPGGDLGEAAAHLIGRLLHRPPGDGEVDELVGEMQACLDAGACVDHEAAARWLCQRLADSTEFSTY